MISIINYGLGNLKAIQNVYSRLGIKSNFVSTIEELSRATKLILPGVGSFDYAIDKLNKSGMLDCLNNLVIEKEIPILGICVGFQMMTKSSEEGKLEGLGWLNARVKKFDITNNESMLLPHMGWNDVEVSQNSPLFINLEHFSKFYFLHSYYIKSNIEQQIIAYSNYGGKFACALNKNNIFGVQFHPEKSHHFGIKLLENFAKV